jgi:hypothetical protein
MWPWAEKATNRTWISGLIFVLSEDMVDWRIVWMNEEFRGVNLDEINVWFLCGCSVFVI